VAKTVRSSANQLANLQKGIEHNKRRGEATHCHKGHSDWGRTKQGKRYCRPCKVQRNREWRQRNKLIFAHPVRVSKMGARLQRPLTFEERQVLRQKISEIQTARENHIRRMWIRTLDGDRVYLGGESRPREEQIKSGYPSVWDQAA
jgi:hypothetical protein